MTLEFYNPHIFNAILCNIHQPFVSPCADFNSCILYQMIVNNLKI